MVGIPNLRINPANLYRAHSDFGSPIKSQPSRVNETEDRRATAAVSNGIKAITGAYERDGGRGRLFHAAVGRRIESASDEEQQVFDEVMEALKNEEPSPNVRTTDHTTRLSSAQGAFVRSEAGDVIVVSSGLSNDLLEQVGLEEASEWVLAKLADEGLEIAPGDGGNRLRDVVSVGTIDVDDFVPRLSDTTTVTIGGETFPGKAVMIGAGFDDESQRHGAFADLIVRGTAVPGVVDRMDGRLLPSVGRGVTNPNLYYTGPGVRQPSYLFGTDDPDVYNVVNGGGPIVEDGLDVSMLNRDRRVVQRVTFTDGARNYAGMDPNTSVEFYFTTEEQLAGAEQPTAVEIPFLVSRDDEDGFDFLRIWSREGIGQFSVVSPEGPYAEVHRMLSGVMEGVEKFNELNGRPSIFVQKGVSTSSPAPDEGPSNRGEGGQSSNPNRSDEGPSNRDFNEFNVQRTSRIEVPGDARVAHVGSLEFGKQFKTTQDTYIVPTKEADTSLLFERGNNGKVVEFGTVRINMPENVSNGEIVIESRVTRALVGGSRKKTIKIDIAKDENGTTFLTRKGKPLNSAELESVARLSSGKREAFGLSGRDTAPFDGLPTDSGRLRGGKRGSGGGSGKSESSRAADEGSSTGGRLTEEEINKVTNQYFEDNPIAVSRSAQNEPLLGSRPAVPFGNKGLAEPLTEGQVAELAEGGAVKVATSDGIVTIAATDAAAEGVTVAEVAEVAKGGGLISAVVIAGVATGYDLYSQLADKDSELNRVRKEGKDGEFTALIVNTLQRGLTGFDAEPLIRILSGDSKDPHKDGLLTLDNLANSNFVEGQGFINPLALIFGGINEAENPESSLRKAIKEGRVDKEVAAVIGLVLPGITARSGVKLLEDVEGVRPTFVKSAQNSKHASLDIRAGGYYS